MTITTTMPTYRLRQHARLSDAIADARRMADLHAETFTVFADNYYDGYANHVGYSVTNAAGIAELGIDSTAIVGTVSPPMEYPVEWAISA